MQATGRARRRSTLEGIGASLIALIGSACSLIGMDGEVAAPNPTVYLREVVLAVEVTGDAEAWLTAEPMTDAGDLGVVLTADRPVVVGMPVDVLDPRSAWLDGTDARLAEPGQPMELPADTPRLVTLRSPTEEVPIDKFGTSYLIPALAQTSMSLRIEDGEGGSGTVEVTVEGVERTGDDVGVPGRVDVPDQELPRPEPGQALALALEDGTPVFAVGLGGDEVVVLSAVSSHLGLVGWCPSLPGFTDSPGATQFTATGEPRFGPGPWGLTPYLARVEDDHIVVTNRGVPSPRPTEPVAVAFPPIPGSSVEQTGPCTPAEVPEPVQIGGGVAIVEDYSANPGWTVHDLSAWPRAAGILGGWRRATLDGTNGEDGFVGDVLIHSEPGRPDEVLAPPGTPWVNAQRPNPVRVGLVVQTGVGPTTACPSCPEDMVEMAGVDWLTPTGTIPIDPVDPDIAQPRTLVAGSPGTFLWTRPGEPLHEMVGWVVSYRLGPDAILRDVVGLLPPGQH